MHVDEHLVNYLLACASLAAENANVLQAPVVRKESSLCQHRHSSGLRYVLDQDVLARQQQRNHRLVLDSDMLNFAPTQLVLMDLELDEARDGNNGARSMKLSKSNRNHAVGHENSDLWNDSKIQKAERPRR